MLSRYLDLTEEANAAEDTFVVIDVSNYDYFLVQPIGDGATVEVTLDGGAVQGESDGGTATATNFITASGIQISSGSLTGGIADGDIVRYDVIGRYVKISSGGLLFSKLLVMLAKIS
jgi:hypothetical protein